VSRLVGLPACGTLSCAAPRDPEQVLRLARYRYAPAAALDQACRPLDKLDVGRLSLAGVILQSDPQVTDALKRVLRKTAPDQVSPPPTTATDHGSPVPSSISRYACRLACVGGRPNGNRSPPKYSLIIAPGGKAPARWKASTTRRKLGSKIETLGASFSRAQPVARTAKVASAPGYLRQGQGCSSRVRRRLDKDDLEVSRRRLDTVVTGGDGELCFPAGRRLS
jgi:hypothetical protein